MHRYQELKVWKKAIDLVASNYTFTDNFPTKEQSGLTMQINRCSVSIVSDIAEGAGRNSKKEFNQFLGIATESLFELKHNF
jgi:four helix bundle protein